MSLKNIYVFVLCVFMLFSGFVLGIIYSENLHLNQYLGSIVGLFASITAIGIAYFTIRNHRETAKIDRTHVYINGLNSRHGEEYDRAITKLQYEIDKLRIMSYQEILDSFELKSKIVSVLKPTELAVIDEQISNINNLARGILNDYFDEELIIKTVGHLFVKVWYECWPVIVYLQDINNAIQKTVDENELPRALESFHQYMVERLELKNPEKLYPLPCNNKRLGMLVEFSWFYGIGTAT